jgi:hypothetical protein
LTADKIDAGDFSSWLDAIRKTLLTGQGIAVPCGDCTACCTSSLFIYIGPDEAETIESIPEELLFTAPASSIGYFVLGYDKNGNCPMLKENTCSIYKCRPVTCSNFDCRIWKPTEPVIVMYVTFRLPAIGEALSNGGIYFG